MTNSATQKDFFFFAFLKTNDVRHVRQALPSVRDHPWISMDDGQALVIIVPATLKWEDAL